MASETPLGTAIGVATSEVPTGARLSVQVEREMASTAMTRRRRRMCASDENRTSGKRRVVDSLMNGVTSSASATRSELLNTGAGVVEHELGLATAEAGSNG
jgi:hypothetical protein